MLLKNKKAVALEQRLFVKGTRKGNRTPTVLLPPDFESGASTSSATRA